MNLEQLLSGLAEAPGLPGYEAPVRGLIKEAWAGLLDEIETDTLGSIYGVRRGSLPAENRPRLLITAHMDEIGLMVTEVEGGFLRFTEVGGIDKRVLLGQPVLVHAEKPLRGYIGSRAPHVVPAGERKSHLDVQHLVIDTGLPAPRLKRMVPVGTPVTFDQRARGLGEGLLTCKALDNRASVAALTLLLEQLQALEHGWDVIVAATTQEEVGLKGAGRLAWQLQPQAAIVVDTTFGVGVGVGEDKGFKLGGGPALGLGPNVHPRLFEHLREAAKQIEMSVQVEPLTARSGTEAEVVQVSRDGVPAALISIPIRNMHSPVEVVALKDIERTARLLAAFIMGLDDQTLGRLSLAASGP